METRIIGIALVRNEEAFVATALRNALHLCDRILVVDNGSTDRTLEDVARVAAETGRVEIHRSSNARLSHELILPYANTATWIFGIDGDEIYDPRGLEKLRAEVLRGDYDAWWVVFGNVLNCTQLDRVRGTATGHLTPPCRSMTKLYNFNAITGWEGDVPQRLHGGRIVFKETHDASRRLNLHERMTWDESHYRCLHLCFLPRSSALPAGESGRLNVTESIRWGIAGRVWRRIAGLAGVRIDSGWKLEKYRRGEPVTVDATPFFSQEPGVEK